MLQAPNHLRGPPLDRLQEIPACFNVGAQNWTQYFKHGLTRAEQSGRITSPDPPATTGILGLKGALLKGNLLSRSFSAELIYSRSSPILNWWVPLFLPRCKSLHLLLLNLIRFLTAQLSSLSRSTLPLRHLWTYAQNIAQRRNMFLIYWDLKYIFWEAMWFYTKHFFWLFKSAWLSGWTMKNRKGQKALLISALHAFVDHAIFTPFENSVTPWQKGRKKCTWELCSQAVLPNPVFDRTLLLYYCGNEFSINSYVVRCCIIRPFQGLIHSNVNLRICELL